MDFKFHYVAALLWAFLFFLNIFRFYFQVLISIFNAVALSSLISFFHWILNFIVSSTWFVMKKILQKCMNVNVSRET